jgi:SNF2 family DNA or RNA helicase
MFENEAADTAESNANVLSLSDFVTDFGDDLLHAVSRQNPPVYDGTHCAAYDAVMDRLSRTPFPAQREVVQAVAKLLVDADQPAAIINAEMGTGKTCMSISLAAVLQQAEGYGRVLVIAPPHLVYKWRREILETLPSAKVTVLNGPCTLGQLLKLRAAAQEGRSDNSKEFFVLGRVRMRMGFHWKPSFTTRKVSYRRDWDGLGDKPALTIDTYAACPHCGTLVTDSDGNPVPPPCIRTDVRARCKQCKSPLWTLMRAQQKPKSHIDLVADALCQIPTIGPKTAAKLIDQFGDDQLSEILDDNVYDFINLMDSSGELVFNDKQAKRMERAMANVEFSFGQGGYQATEFIKRYLPGGYFDLLIVDEGHEYKNEGSAQGQAMAVLVSKVRKVVLLTGTLMGGYADDLFHLLWRVMPVRMIEDGYRYRHGSIGPAAMAFMRHHGVLKDIYRETESKSHKTAKGKSVAVHTSRAPGFGPDGIARYVLPFTVFLKLKDLGPGVLPEYREHFHEIALTAEQAQQYAVLKRTLVEALRAALRVRDKSLLGVVLSVLLAWPDCCFKEEVVRHPRTRAEIIRIPALFGPEPTPKELDLLEVAKRNKAAGRRVLVYTTYTQKRDTTARLKLFLERHGVRVAVLHSSVDASRREDWIAEQMERGVDIVITNAENVKTGLDLLGFPTIYNMQTGSNVYTLQQGSRRSWRIGQTEDVDVYFSGYRDTKQIDLLSLMAKKIAVSQSTSGDMPDTGLDVLDTDDDSIEMALAKQLLAEA